MSEQKHLRWERTTVEKWAPFTYGKGLPERNRRGGDVPVYGSNGIVGWHYSPVIDGPGIVIGRKGTVGSVHYSPVPFWPIDTTYFVVGAPHRDLRFTAALLSDLGLEDRNSHSAVPGLSRDDAHQIDIIVPPLSEQRRIAEVLNVLDDRINQGRVVQHVLATTAQTLVQTAMELCTISSIAVVHRAGFEPTRHPDMVVDHYSLPAFDAGQCPDRVQASSIGSNKLVIPKPSVLLSRLNPATNRTWLVVPSSEVDISVCSTEYAVLEPSTVSVGVLWASVSSNSIGEQLIASTTGTSSSHQRVRAEDVLALQVRDPRTLGNRSSTEIETMAENVLRLRSELQSAIQLRDFLLPRLLSGELRVAAAEEMAEVG